LLFVGLLYLGRVGRRIPFLLPAFSGPMSLYASVPALVTVFIAGAAAGVPVVPALAARTVSNTN
jgi:hypothetical protein